MSSEGSVLITGASSGIGKASALHLDREGFRVFAGVREPEDMKTLRKEASDRLLPVSLDVTIPGSISAAVETVAAETSGSLYGLVNNAGIGISGVLEATPAEELRRVLEVNVIGLHAVTRAFLPLLRNQKGRVINIGSSAGFLAIPGGSSYSASKFAVRAITDSLRIELKPFGMNVSLIAPGAIESDIWDKSRQYREKLKRTASPELHELYRPFILAAEKFSRSVRPIPAVAVANAVEHALSAGKPRNLYLVGSDAKKAHFLSGMPGRFAGWLMMKHITRAAESQKAPE